MQTVESVMGNVQSVAWWKTAVWRPSIQYTLIGAGVASGILHPLVEALHLWRTSELVRGFQPQIIIEAYVVAFGPNMFGMTLGFALFGAASGALFAHMQRRLVQRRKRSLPAVWTPQYTAATVAKGETETVEFKSSLRWDHQLNRVNKALEFVVVKSIAGLMNHRGGTLLIGVGDRGEAIGIERVFQSLGRSNWDNFKRCLYNTARSHLGGNACTRIHCFMIHLSGQSVAMVDVERAVEPVFCLDVNVSKYFVRAGNTTRELDVKEAIAHLAGRAR